MIYGHRPATYDYDVFISYDEQNITDSTWVQAVLIPRFEARRVRLVPPILIGESTIRYITRAIDTSRYTLMVLSSSYVSRAWNQAEQAMLQTRDPVNAHRRFLPLLLTPCDIPANMRVFATADFTAAQIDDETWERLFLAIEAAPPRTPDPRTIPPISALSSPSRMPYAPNPLFVGRHEELLELAQLLILGATAAVGQITAASGLGGIGKTQLAVEFVHRYGARFRGGVFWLNMAEAASVPAEVAACAEELGFNIADRPIDEQVRQVQRLWREPTPRLLVFDNCEDEELFKCWRPTTGGCSVLVTTRRATWRRSLGVRTLALGVLPRSESIALLQQHRPDLAADDPVVGAIAAAVGDLPLALHLAGSYLDAYGRSVSPKSYLTQIQSSDLLTHPCFQSAEILPTGHAAHVARTFAVSTERLDPSDTTDALALSLLARMGCLAPGEAVPLTFLAATVAATGDETITPQLEAALKRLGHLGLLHITAEAAQIHRLLHTFVCALPHDGSALTAVEQALEATAVRLNNEGDPRKLFPLQEHLRYAVHAATDRTDTAAANLTSEFGIYVYLRGDYTAALALFEHALYICECAVGPNHPLTAEIMGNLAAVLQATGDYAAARPFFERALSIDEQALGSEHPSTARSLNNLASLINDTGDYGAARPLFERALAINEQMLGPEHPFTATSLNNLALLLETTGEYRAARPLYERALAINEQTLGAQHPLTAHSLNNLAKLLQDMGDYGTAHPLLERALTIWEQVLGPEHPDTQTSRQNLVDIVASMSC